MTKEIIKDGKTPETAIDGWLDDVYYDITTIKGRAAYQRALFEKLKKKREENKNSELYTMKIDTEIYKVEQELKQTEKKLQFEEMEENDKTKGDEENARKTKKRK